LAVKGREMNNYSHKAICSLIERLEVRHYEIDGDSVILINYYDNDKLVEIELPPSEVYISLGKGKRIKDKEGNPFNKIIEEFMDLLFEVEFNKVPLYMGRLPDIVAWRLEMGE